MQRRPIDAAGRESLSLLDKLHTQTTPPYPPILLRGRFTDGCVSAVLSNNRRVWVHRNYSLVGEGWTKTFLISPTPKVFSTRHLASGAVP